MPSLQVITLGCSKNTVDTEHLLYQVRGSYELVPEGEDRPVDVLLVNTCGFIGDAKEQSIQTILNAAARKQQGLCGRLLVFGCLSQRYAHELPDLIPEVDGWFGARELDPLVRALGCTPDPLSAHRRVRTDGHHPYAFLKISEGCDRRCSYCAIPFIRGKHRSVPMEVLVQEAKALAADGVRELVVIAQDTTYYGLDLYGRRALAELLQRLSEVEGIEWIRIHYSYPASFPEDVLDLMASEPKICPYLDIPLQHIADPVLKAMRRGIDSDGTRALIAGIRSRVPGIVLRTTMMVGHPGEGEEEFAQLLDFVRDTRFERLGAFIYSEEEGTYGAGNLEDSVPQAEKQSRLDRLMELQREISASFNRSRVGNVERVLVDEVQDGVCICRSRYESPDVDGEIIVRTDDAPAPGTFVTVRITGADDYDLTAELL